MGKKINPYIMSDTCMLNFIVRNSLAEKKCKGYANDIAAPEDNIQDNLTGNRAELCKLQFNLYYHVVHYL